MPALGGDSDGPLVYWIVPKDTVETDCPDHGPLAELESLTVERFGHPRDLKDDYVVRICPACLEEYKSRDLPSLGDDVAPVVSAEIERRWKAHPLPDGDDLGEYFEM